MMGTTLRPVGQARTSSTGLAQQESQDPTSPPLGITHFASQVEAIAISDDGNHVAAVGIGARSAGLLEERHILDGASPAAHLERTRARRKFVDVAMSDDGNYVAVAGAGAVPSTVYYWAGATSRTGTSEPHTWAGGVNVRFTSVDMSCDGDSVIAGTGLLSSRRWSWRLGNSWGRRPRSGRGLLLGRSPESDRQPKPQLGQIN